MPRRKPTKTLSSESSDDEPLSKKITKPPKTAAKDDSSSESDIENYLQPADKLDLDSPFFSLQKDEAPSFDKIENDILGGVTALNDSESDDEPPPQALPSTSKVNFHQLHEYTRKMEEMRRHAEEYEARKRAEVQQMDVSNLLAAGEALKVGGEDEEKALEELKATLHSSDFESCSDSEREGWEEVGEKKKEEDSVPKEGLQITVEMPGAMRKKKGVDLMAAIKRRINRVKKENQVLIHKVHLLCWIAHGNYVNSIVNSQNVLSVALSLLPSEKCYPAERTDLNYLEQVLKWYRNAVMNVEKAVPKSKGLEKLLETQIVKKEAYNKKMLVYIFIAILRSLGIQCRLVLSFQVEPLRPPNSELCSLSTKNDKDKANTSKKTNSTKTKSEETKTKVQKDSDNKKARSKSASDIGKLKVEEDKKPRSKSTSKVEVEDKNKNQKTTNAGGSSKETKKVQSKSTRKLRSQKESIPQLDGANDSDEEMPLQVDGSNDSRTSKPNLKKLKEKQSICPAKEHPKRLKTKITKYKDSDSEDDFSTKSQFFNKNKESPQSIKPKSQKNQSNGSVNLRKLKEIKTPPKKTLDVRNDIVNLLKNRIKKQKDIDRTKTVKKRRSTQDNENDSDYVPEAIKKKHRDSADDFSPNKIKVKRRIQVKENENDEEKKKKQGTDVWAEVFLETEEKWISVDVVKGQVHCVNELFTRATHPVSYIVAWNNNQSLKDITRRYCQNFNTITRKLRIDTKWWESTLTPWLGPKNARDREEDDELERQQLEKPLPKSIAEYKDHPLYVLKRHLLKFQAIYPPDAPTLGFVRNEPVYSRQCVYTLHSRDIWLKHAKVVKLGEKPYKIVKARPRYDKLSNTMITDQLLEIFGPWQTEDYVPPTAENGVVPRNAYGNVELFKSCMLPKKTVHLKLPGLNKIAKRMDIDCAPAMIGFDFHGGWNHPTFDGFVVCEEFADVLVAAWELEQDEIEKREQEKIDKRVYGNWKRLIKGLLIRERLKVKYDFGETLGGKGKKKAKSGIKLATKKRKCEKIQSDSESD